jgi:hypothetical protein
MQISMPVPVYDVRPEDRKIPEDNWGWVELRDPADWAGYTSFELIRFYASIGTPPMKNRGEWNRHFHYLRKPCGVVTGEENLELRSLRVPRDTMFDTATFFNYLCEDCRCCQDCLCGTASLEEQTFYEFVERHPIMVPARWAKEVATEIRFTQEIDMLRRKFGLPEKVR